MFVVQAGVEPADIETAQATYSLIETTQANPFHDRRVLQRRLLESAMRDPKIAEVFLRALALKPSSVPQHTQRFATHFDPSLFLKNKTGSAQLAVGASASRRPRNSPHRAAVFAAGPARGIAERLRLLNKNPYFLVIIPSDRKSFLDGLAMISQRDNISASPRAKLIVVKLSDGGTEIRMLQSSMSHGKVVLEGERIVWRGSVRISHDGSKMDFDGLDNSNSSDSSHWLHVPHESIKTVIGDVNLEPHELAMLHKTDKPPPRQTPDVDAYVKISSLAEALTLPMMREVNMFVVVRLKDGSIEMRAGAGLHMAMMGENDDLIASGWYEVKGRTVTLHIDGREGDISDMEIDRLIRSRVFK
ncbi:MAG: hypothetical protein HY877_02670 [Deltaproteobacteria bacterium]|nr:hypothetical protein [Deltaproteobacteria bacterium]